MVLKCAGARGLPRMGSAAQSPPATVSGASYAAAAVTMAHYKVRGARHGWGRAGGGEPLVGSGWDWGCARRFWGPEVVKQRRGLPNSQRLLPAPAPGFRALTRRVSSGRRLEARAVPKVLGEVGGAGHADQG